MAVAVATTLDFAGRFGAIHILVRVRVKIDLGYDGTRFHGWARQPGMATVQGTVEKALSTILRAPFRDPGSDGTSGNVHPSIGRLVVAGRTDAGVHAAHQVCHLDVDDFLLQRLDGHGDVEWDDVMTRRLNHLLPGDIRIRSVSEAPAGFDARFSALDRVYVYRLVDGDGVVDPRLRGFVSSCRRRLDLDAMNEAARSMIGLHDFGSFAIPNPHGTTIRNVLEASWRRIGRSPDGFMGDSVTDLVEFTIRADAFAHNMVRSLVGAEITVGSGVRDPQWLASKIAVPLREGFTGPAPARGLTLEHVEYPDDSALAVRAEAIKALRTLDD